MNIVESTPPNLTQDELLMLAAHRGTDDRGRQDILTYALMLAREYPNHTKPELSFVQGGAS